MENQNTKVSPQTVEAVIVDEKYITPPGSPMLTICVLTLKNGARVSGTNFGAIDPRWHSAEKGKEEARRIAVDKVYELENYLLRQRLMEQSNSAKANTTDEQG